MPASHTRIIHQPIVNVEYALQGVSNGYIFLNKEPLSLKKFQFFILKQ